MTAAAARRSMAATVGMPFSVTVPFPDSTNDQVSRWHGAFCYLLEQGDLPVPTIGWQMSSAERVFIASRSPRVWKFKD
jgi:hypothetical protein